MTATPQGRQEPETLRFFFDVISHNAYIAWTQLPDLERRFGVRVDPVPVLFAGLLGHHGQLGPAEVWPKARWMGRNVMRKAKLLGVELSPPVHHPFNPLLALRASSLPLDDDVRRRLIDGLFRAVWVERRHVSEPEVVAEVARRAGLDGDETVRLCASDETKARLRRQTDEAIALDVFGVPSMIFRDEVFFGYDDFPYLELVLAGEDPLDAETLAAWASAGITPSAQRQRPKDGSS